MAESGARTQAQGGTPERHFLGWSEPLLDAVADWLCARREAELGQLLVALPASRAGRGLAARLARRRGPAARPPRVLTTGALTDELLRIDAPIAGRMARTLAWQRALRELPPRELARLVPRPPRADDFHGWTRLAEALRTLFGELAADGVVFGDVPARLPALAGDGERERWLVLGALAERMQALLAQAGAVDPHMARLGALERGAIDREREVVLIGVSDLNGLQRRLLEQLGARVTALVLAPEELAQDFDALGCLRVERWRERAIPLPLARWRVVDRPEDQAREAARLLALHPRRFAAQEITIGLANAELAPYLARHFRAAGLALRDGAGTPLEHSSPARLLTATARALAGWRMADYAALVRQPDLEAALRARGVSDPVALVDRYRVEHLAPRADGEWLGRSAERAAMAELHGALRSLLGELAAPTPRALSDWAAPVREFLVAVFADRGAGDERHGEAERQLAGALSAIGAMLSELAELPAALAPECEAAAALAFLGRALRGQAIPPPPAERGAPTIEMLGWLELLLDPAPALIVTGFEEGRVPESVHGDPFLPDGLRRSLGILDNERRCARDAYAVTAMLASRAEIYFVSGRRSASNDPQLPSRLAFHCEEEAVLERVRYYLGAAQSQEARPARALSGGRPPRILARREPVRAPEIYRVTDFSKFLASPYLYYLQRVLELDTVEDRAHELGPRGFGILAHDALRDFGRGELRDSGDEAAVARELDARLENQARALLGNSPLPAVALQLDQLRWRLTRFAARQAARAREGWRITHVEWQPTGAGVPLDVDGSPITIKGRIDRIDHHPELGWAIFDYKTGESSQKVSPAKAHRTRDGSWRDLQLPLYCLLTAELAMEGMPRLGYASLGKGASQIEFVEVHGWDEDVLESAYEAAREVVRRVRRGELFDAGDPRVDDEPVLRGLLGLDLLDTSGDEEEEEQGS